MSYTFETIYTATSIPYCSIDASGKNIVFVNNPNTTQDIFVGVGIDSPTPSTANLYMGTFSV